MKKSLFLPASLYSSVLYFLSFHIASAHEVYVLSNADFLQGLNTSSPDPLTMITAHPGDFAQWAVIGFLLVSTVFFASITHRAERLSAPLLHGIKKYAAPIARVTLGVSLIACAYHGALFGPEITLESLGSPLILTSLLYVLGALITLGFWTRSAALVFSFVYALAVYSHGFYMLTYANYFGEIIIVAVLGGGYLSIDKWRRGEIPKRVRHIASKLEQRAWFALRVLFGASLIYAALFAKFIHSNLALMVVNQYHLTNYFHFEPLFIVLGAGLIEIATGLMFIFGIELRHTALFLLFWLTLSLLYFQESVWPHGVLIGILIAFVCHGYDKYSVEGMFFRREKLEPVL